MKVPSRILIPVVAAGAIAALLILLLWWQLGAAADRLKQEVDRIVRLPDMLESPAATAEIPADQSDRSLLHLREGDLFALEGQWAEAENEYELSVEAGGGIPALRKLAQAQLQRRNLDGARATIRKLRTAGARAEDLLLLEATVELRMGELVKAREILIAAEDSPQKHYGLSLLAIVQGLHEEAQKELAITAEGWDPVLRTSARTLQSAYDEFALFPESQETHLITLLARSLAQVQECELALPLLVQVLKQQDDYRDAWTVQGYCELVTERSEQALASLERAYAIDPEKPEIQYFLARAHAALADHGNAITFFTYALQNGFEPEREVRRLIVEEALASERSDLALEHLQILTSGADADLGSTRKLVTLLLSLGNKEEAYGAALTASTAFPRDAAAFELLGIAASESGRKEEARAAFEKALEINPGLMSAKERLEKL